MRSIKMVAQNVDVSVIWQDILEMSSRRIPDFLDTETFPLLLLLLLLNI